MKNHLVEPLVARLHMHVACREGSRHLGAGLDLEAFGAVQGLAGSYKVPLGQQDGAGLEHYGYDYVYYKQECKAMVNLRLPG